MRYPANASRSFVRGHFPDGFSGAADRIAPIVAYDPVAIVQACLAGLGGGFHPEPLVKAHLARRRLCDIVPDRFLEVPLYWQHWSIKSRTLEALAGALRAQAATALPQR